MGGCASAPAVFPSYARSRPCVRDAPTRRAAHPAPVENVSIGAVGFLIGLGLLVEVWITTAQPDPSRSSAW